MATYMPNLAVWNNWIGTNQTTSASNINVWQYWNGQPIQSNVKYDIWQAWTAGATVTAATTYQADIWAGWNVRGSQPSINIQPQYAPPPPPTPEQLAAQEKYRQEQFQLREVRRKKMVQAEERAEMLLLEHLDDKQKQDYREKQAFDVEVDGKTYRVGQGTHGNVREILLHEGREVTTRRFCIPSRVRDMPEADVHLAQKLMIEGAMDEFERIANVSVYRPELIRVDGQLERELAQIR